MIPADQRGDFTGTGGKGAKTQVSGREIKFFVISGVIGNVHLAVDAGDPAVGVNDRGTVVINSRCPAFEERCNDNGLSFLCHATQCFRGGSWHGLRQFKIRGVFALAEVLRSEKFRQADYLRARMGGFLNMRAGTREVFGGLGADAPSAPGQR